MFNLITILSRFFFDYFFFLLLFLSGLSIFKMNVPNLRIKLIKYHYILSQILWGKKHMKKELYEAYLRGDSSNFVESEESYYHHQYLRILIILPFEVIITIMIIMFLNNIGIKSFIVYFVIIMIFLLFFNIILITTIEKEKDKFQIRNEQFHDPKNKREKWIDLKRINEIQYLSRIPEHQIIYYDNSENKVELINLNKKDTSKLLEIFKTKNIKIEKKGIF
jgi:hypothetical protein